MTTAACTIVSVNYLAYARTLSDSFLRMNPDSKFFVLLVDRPPSGWSSTDEHFEVFFVEDLGIPEFNDISFKYDILELNTNVKPTFLKFLLGRGIGSLLYLDPDIEIYHPLNFIYALLDEFAIVLTPHCISPTPVEDRNLEQAFLSLGVFNLGFLGVSGSPEARRFLDWWEDRCLGLGYAEARTGLFVDQKWANLVPCFFERVKILTHLGCNVAYWNIFERQLTVEAGTYSVNAVAPLIFFHFSGVDASPTERISPKARPDLTFASRPDLRPLFEGYKSRLRKNQRPTEASHQYAFRSFSNGVAVSTLARRVYGAIYKDARRDEDPFSTSGWYYRLAKRRRLIGQPDSSMKYSSGNVDFADRRLKLINFLFRALLLLLGNDRYSLLLKYLAYVSTLRNQHVVLDIKSTEGKLR